MKNRYFESYESYKDLQMLKALSSLDTPEEALLNEYDGGVRAGKRKAIEKIRQYVDVEEKVLILGARRGSEVLFFREAGYDKITAVDLYDPPLSDLVVTGDAHFLSEIDNCQGFSLVFAHHVFEHFFKPSKVLEEIHKVSLEKSFLYIGLPFAKGRNEYDAQDEFSTQQEFEQMVKSYGYEIHDSFHHHRGRKKQKLYQSYIFRKKGN